MPPLPLGMGPGLTRGRARVAQDDCWERKIPPRDLKTGRLVGDPTRFPSGMKALGDCAPPPPRPLLPLVGARAPLPAAGAGRLSFPLTRQHALS